jgi:Transcription-silencing protein, cryptic loci regulator Clr2
LVARQQGLVVSNLLIQVTITPPFPTPSSHPFFFRYQLTWPRFLATWDVCATLPAGYVLISRPRDGRTGDILVHGHPGGKTFDRAVEFAKHLWWLARGVGKCGCMRCVKEGRKDGEDKFNKLSWMDGRMFEWGLPDFVRD